MASTGSESDPLWQDIDWYVPETLPSYGIDI